MNGVDWEAHYLPDIEYLIWYRPYEGDPEAVVVEFQAVQVVTFDEDGRPEQVERIAWQGMGGWTDLDDREMSNIFLEGSVKWDGCSNMDFHATDCLKHFCGQKDAMKLGTLMDHIYEICWQFHFDVNCKHCGDRGLYEGR